MTRQLVLDLAPAPRFGVEDFLVSSCNEAAYALIELWPDWPEPVLLLTGPQGAGKSHIGAIWAARARARKITGAMLAATDPLELAAAPALLIDDAEDVGPAEAALFHLLNLAREHATPLLLTARHPAQNWGLATLDLLSRLRLAPGAAIGAPDEALLRAVLVKLFVDRQIVVDTGLIDYVALRLERSLEAARRFVAALDQESLARGRRITQATAREVLAGLWPEEK